MTSLKYLFVLFSSYKCILSWKGYSIFSLQKINQGMCKWLLYWLKTDTKMELVIRRSLLQLGCWLDSTQHTAPFCCYHLAALLQDCSTVLLVKTAWAICQILILHLCSFKHVCQKLRKSFQPINMNFFFSTYRIQSNSFQKNFLLFKQLIKLQVSTPPKYRIKENTKTIK